MSLYLEIQENVDADIDIETEVINLINWISKYGKDSNGGITRLLFTREWLDTQEALKKLMCKKDIYVYYDEVGNLFGRLNGTTYKDETILTGSHIDTVKNGGTLDGQLGIIAGIIAIRYLKEKYGDPLRNIEVVSISEEEGSRFPFAFWGSKNIVGTVKEEVEGIKDSKGKSFVDEMHKAGFGFKQCPKEIREDLKCFIELHVEQGGVLEFEKKSIGIVENIVGQRRFTFKVQGESNHAGTTPMEYRKDALYLSSKIIQNILDSAYRYGAPLVATVGRLEIEPNTVNVIPGRVTFTLDIRHVDKEVLIKFSEEIVKKTNSLAKKWSMKIDIDMWMDCEPVAMDTKLVNIIKKQCEKEGFEYKLMHSGAGHDSQVFAQHIPTALVFVPSHKGISHSPLEHTEPKDLVKGIRTLIETLYYLGYKE